MSAPPYMRWFPGDYAKDTTHLNRCEHGSYRLLIDAMWAAGGRLPADDTRLARLAKCSAAEWADCKAVILEFFYRDGASFRHRRVDRELARSGAKSEAASKAGKSSAEKRSNKNSDKGSTDVDPTLNHARFGSDISLTEVGREPDLFDLGEEEEPRAKPKPKATLTKAQMADFERWYATYPLHKARGHAEPAFVRALALSDLDTLIAGAMAYARQVAGLDRSKIAHPATWLNGKYWLDETAVVRGETVVAHPAMTPAQKADFDQRMAAYTARLAAEQGIATA